MKKILILIAMTLLTLTAFAQPVGEKYLIEVGWQYGKYEPTYDGISKAFARANKIYTSLAVTPTIEFAPGVYDIGNHYVTIQGHVTVYGEGVRITGASTAGIFIDNNQAVQMSIYGSIELYDPNLGLGQAVINFQNGSSLLTDLRYSNIVAGATNWGSINGTLTDQTDLVSALGAKQNSLTNIKETSSGDSVKFYNKYTFPFGDGSDGQVLITNGNGEVTWGNQTGSGSSFTNIAETPTNDSVKFYNKYTFPFTDGANGQVLKTNGDGEVTWQDDAAGSGSGIYNLVEDLTPQLGGNLDLNGYHVTGLQIGADVQAYDADLTTYAGITPSSNVQSLLGSADYSAMRTNLGLAIGTNVQGYSSVLTTYAGITPAANVQSLLGAADYAAMKTLLGLVIGTNVQAYDADLTTYAGITPSANVQTLLGAANYAAFKTSLSLNSVENTALSTWAGTSNLLLTNLGGTLAVSHGGTGTSSQTASRLVTTDGSGNIVTSLGVTATEAGYLSGVSSGIQGQINGKQAADADLTTWAGITPSANMQSFAAGANYAAMRTSLGVYSTTEIDAKTVTQSGASSMVVGYGGAFHNILSSAVVDTLHKYGAMKTLSDDTTPKLGGNVQWNGYAFFLNGQTLDGSVSNGELVINKSGTWDEADASTEAGTTGMMGICVNSTIGAVLTFGVYTTTGLTAGDTYYASETEAGITTTKPTTPGSITRVIGYAISTTQLYFNPGATYVEHQ